MALSSDTKRRVEESRARTASAPRVYVSKGFLVPCKTPRKPEQAKTQKAKGPIPWL